MKWSKFIQDDNKFLKELSPAAKLNSSRSMISNSGGQFVLKSIQKVKADTSSSKLNRIPSHSSINSSDIRRKILMTKHISNPPPQILNKQIESSPNIMNQSRLKIDDSSDMTRIIDQFSKQLSQFIRNFIEKVITIKNNKEFKEEMIKKISTASQIVINKLQAQKFEVKISPIRKSLSCMQNNLNGIKMKQQGSQKKKARVLQFKKEKVNEKNAFNKIQDSIYEVNKLLENQRPPKFIRTSRQRIDRSQDSSGIQRSLSQSKRIYKSRLKSKDILYKLNKILNQ